jgi:hypothetical protein
VDRTTIGRVEDNTFQIADPSVSSHHCEVHLRGSEILIRDLNSTNGSFINEVKITEQVLKPGQTLRLGNVEIGSSEAAPAPPVEPAAAKKAGGRHHGHAARRQSRSIGKRRTPAGFRLHHRLFKKRNKANTFFIIGVIADCRGDCRAAVLRVHASQSALTNKSVRP